MWAKLRICLRKRHLCLGSIIAFVILGYLYSYPILKDILADMNCSDEESKALIAHYCQLYRQKVIVGDLCSPLCDDSSVEYDKCTNFHAGKHVIFMNCHGFCKPGKMERAVLKTRLYNSTKMKDAHLVEYIAQDRDARDMSHLRDFVKDSVAFDLGARLPPEEDVLRLMWEDNYRAYFATLESRTAMAVTVMSLMQQSEYQLTKFLQREKFMPKIYGTCGPLYLVEFTPPGNILSSEEGLKFWKHRVVPWRQRAKLAQKLLQLIKVLDSKLSALHLCDVKGENFGIGEDNEIKLIDTDTVFVASKMIEEFKNTPCETDKHCPFFDCKGHCDQVQGHCLPLRTNNNLQTLCEKVFTRHLLPGLGVGLLGDAPSSISADIQDTVMECAFSTQKQNGITVMLPGEKIYERLQHLLETDTDEMAVSVKHSGRGCAVEEP